MHKLLNISKHWAIDPDYLQGMITNVDGFSLTSDPPLKDTRSVSIRDGTAIIPIKGPITSQENMFTMFFGGTALDTLAKDLHKAVNDDSVKAILLDVDSPGGVAVGPSEVADMIYQARSKKPVWSYIGRHGCSAAYWLACAADKVIANRSALVGSVGVVTAIPVQEKPDSEGYLTIEIVSSNASNKRPDPRTDDGIKEIRRELDSLEGEFTNNLAKYRGVSSDTIRRDFGRGGVVIGTDALSAGMVDSLSSFEELMQELATLHPNVTINNKDTDMSKEPQNTITKETITADLIKADFPEIYQSCKQAGIEEGKAQERNRLLAIEQASLPGHEELVQHAKTNPEMTAEKLALQIVEAEKQKSTSFIEAAREAEEKLPDIPATTANTSTISSDAPLETRAKHDWEHNPTLRSEFSNDYDAYFAYKQASEQGQVKILKQQ
jgi:ClpP class serine protease